MSVLVCVRAPFAASGCSKQRGVTWLHDPHHIGGLKPKGGAQFLRRFCHASRPPIVNRRGRLRVGDTPIQHQIISTKSIIYVRILSSYVQLQFLSCGIFANEHLTGSADATGGSALRPQERSGISPHDKGEMRVLTRTNAGSNSFGLASASLSPDVNESMNKRQT